MRRSIFVRLLAVPLMLFAVGCAGEPSPDPYQNLEASVGAVVSDLQLVDLEPSPDDPGHAVRRARLSDTCTCPLVSVAGFRSGSVDAALAAAQQVAAASKFGDIEEYRNTAAGIQARRGRRHLQIDIADQGGRARVAVTLYDQTA